MQLSRIQPKEPSQKVSLAFKESTLDRIQDYMALYEQTYGETISRQELIEHMALSVMNRDKTFAAFEKKVRSERAKPKPAVAPAAAPAAQAPAPAAAPAAAAPAQAPAEQKPASVNPLLGGQNSGA